MFWLASELEGYGIQAEDGSIGSVVDLLFDDHDWTVRWLVVDTGSWLSGRQVILPPHALEEPDPAGRVIRASLTRYQVESSPSLDTDAPVSRQMEANLYRYYGWDPYWPVTSSYPGLAVAGAVPPVVAPHHLPPHQPPAREQHTGDPTLRSVGYVTGSAIEARDGSIGHVEDFIVDRKGWTIRYMIVDTVNWWPGKKVLVAPDWIEDISWSEQSVRVKLTRESIKSSPEYVPGNLRRDYEDRLYRHYGYSPYWF